MLNYTAYTQKETDSLNTQTLNRPFPSGTNNTQVPASRLPLTWRQGARLSARSCPIPTSRAEGAEWKRSEFVLVNTSSEDV